MADITYSTEAYWRLMGRAHAECLVEMRPISYYMWFSGENGEPQLLPWFTVEENNFIEHKNAKLRLSKKNILVDI